MLRKGCGGFTAYVKEVVENRGGLGSVPIVREFLDVFPKELPGLPPKREIDL